MGIGRTPDPLGRVVGYVATDKMAVIARVLVNGKCFKLSVDRFDLLPLRAIQFATGLYLGGCAGLLPPDFKGPIAPDGIALLQPGKATALTPGKPGLCAATGTGAQQKHE